MAEPPDNPPVDALIQRLREAACDSVRGAACDSVRGAAYDDTADTEDEVREAIRRYRHAEAEQRKALLRRLRSLAGEQPGAVSPLVPALVPFLTDEERSVRLTAAKLFVRLAEGDPDAVVDAIDPVAERLADPEEFYYVRARAAEALGYAAVEHPEEVVTPDLLAELRVGLSFDEPEVKEKLAKSLAYVALGNPQRLRHKVADLADHLDDEDELVRYYLATAVVAVGCEYSEKLTDGAEDLAVLLEDDSAYVRGRGAEALGLLVRSAPDDVTLSADDVPDPDGEEESFVVDRLQFARNAFAAANPDEPEADGIGTLDGVRETTDGAVQEIRSPDGDGECPHCGLALPENGPPMCPRCGAPY